MRRGMRYCCTQEPSLSSSVPFSALPPPAPSSVQFSCRASRPRYCQPPTTRRASASPTARRPTWSTRWVRCSACRPSQWRLRIVLTCQRRCWRPRTPWARLSRRLSLRQTRQSLCEPTTAPSPCASVCGHSAVSSKKEAALTRHGRRRQGGARCCCPRAALDARLPRPATRRLAFDPGGGAGCPRWMRPPAAMRRLAVPTSWQAATSQLPAGTSSLRPMTKTTVPSASRTRRSTPILMPPSHGQLRTRPS